MSVNIFKNGILSKIAGAVGDAVPLINNFLTNQEGKGAADANTVYVLNNKIEELNSSLEAKGDFELLCYVTSVGDKTVPNLTQYKSIWATLFIDNGLYGTFLIPLSLFKTITTFSRCSHYESSGGYSCDFKYVNDTTINIVKISRITGCYLYGIK